MKNHPVREPVRLLFIIVFFMWMLEGVDTLLIGGALDSFGIKPRTTEGLLGILLAPFLHGGFHHLTANTLPFLILGFLCMSGGTEEFLTVFVSTALISGTATWLTAPASTVHIGASGTIFGMFGYLLFRGIFNRRLFSLVLSITAALLYGGMIRGVLPAQPGISWQSHLFGFLGGIVCARIMARKIRTYRYSN